MMGKGWRQRQKAAVLSVKQRFESATDEAKEQVRAYASTYQAAKAFRRDKPAQRWFDRRCKGQDLILAPEIVAKGVSDGEITQSQADMILYVLGVAGHQASRVVEG